jgi:carboxylesterase type B
MHIFNNPAPEESEDCLYLNVWAPGKKPPAEGWPVMFWIYGGNLQFGHAGTVSPNV